jgi:hypothetical protein
MLLSCIGDRPLGVQARQIAAIARWAKSQHPDEPLQVIAIGPRTSLAALVASALEPEAIAEVEVRESLGSLKEVLENNLGVNQEPTYFCFGLLEEFDILQLTALVAPRRTTLSEPSNQLKAAATPLSRWYKVLQAGD